MVVINLHMLGRLGPCHHLAECCYFTSGMLLPSQMGTKSPFQLYFERQTMKDFVVFLFNVSKQYFLVCLNFERIIFFLSSHVHCVMFHSPVIYPLIGSWLSVFKEKKKKKEMPSNISKCPRED